MNHELKMDYISFAYPGKEVLKGVPLCLHSGDFCALIGPNGSGKSTLLRCLGGLLPVTYGRLTLDGKDLATLPRRQRARTMAYVPQREEALPDITVMEAVLLGRKPHLGASLTDADLEVAAGALRQVDLLARAMGPLRTLSGGQLQRVAVARALCQQPRILLLDEPTSNLDLPHQARLMLHLQRLADEGLIVVIVLHDLLLAARYARRFVLLKEGSVRADGGQEVLTEEGLSALFDFPIGVRHEGEEGLYIGAKF
jgi:iron complex transport system ATP-binding protein